MNRTRLRRGLVLVVVLLLGVSLVGPAAAGPYTTTTGDDDTTGDGILDGGLTDPSSSDTTSDSDDSTAAESDSSGDSGETSDSSDSSSDSGDDGFLSDSGDADSGDDGDGPSGADDDPDDGTLAELDRSTTDSLSTPEGTGGVIDGETIEGAELVTISPTTDDSYQFELLDLSTSEDAVLELTAGTETMTTVTTVADTVDATVDEFGAGTSESLDASPDTARTGSVGSVDDPPPSVDADTAPVEPRTSEAESSDDTTAPRNAIGLSAPGDLPEEPVGAGAVVGLLGTVAAVVGRQSGVFAGMSGNLGTTARTAAAAAPGSSYLDRLVRMLAPFRYSRYDDSDPLEHEARDAMFDVVENSPGTYPSEIADRAELPLSTARHHIRVLEREGLVSGAKVRGKRRFYPAYTDGVELAAAMNDESTASVIDALARLGASSVSDLADELDKDPSTVTHHVQRLEEDEVVVRERDGRAVMNKLSTAARTMLEPEEARPEGAATGEAVASD